MKRERSNCISSRLGRVRVAAGVGTIVTVLAFSAGARAANPAPEPRLDAGTRAAVVDSVSNALVDVYVFPDVAARMSDLIKGRLARGEYDLLTAVPDFARRLTEDLQSVSKDKHLQVLPLPPGQLSGAPQISDEEMQKRALAQEEFRNFGFEKIDHLEGNIGYIDMRGFSSAKYAGQTAIAAMNLLGHCDALIFDLRKNGGGDPTMIQLLGSFLLEEPTHLNSFYIRKGDKTDQFWSYTGVPGPDLSRIPVYVLTSSFTFSCAEEFTYDLKNLKRATIVGEVTGGGAHPVNHRIFAGLPVGLQLPFGRAVNPISGTNWEGTGVEPDIKVPADEALAVAHREALKTVLAATNDPERKQSLEWALQGLDFRANPTKLEAKDLRAYLGSYGPRKITEESGALFYQRETQPRRRLIPGGKDFFLVDGVDYFRVQFLRDERGRVEKLVGIYDNGRTDENPRSGN